MKDKRITIIGGGKIGGCLTKGLLADGYPAESICIATPNVEKLEHIRSQWSIKITADNRHGVQNTDIVILAVKPSVVPTVIHEIKDLLQKQRCLLISVATGITLDYFMQQLGEECPIVRCMPNICAAVRASITGMYALPSVSDEAKDWAESILRSLGTTVWLEKEALLNAITAISGSGPAYFFRVMESLQAAAKTLGLSGIDTQLIVTQTALGATRLAMETQQSFSTLRQQVTSEKGTTAAAIDVLDKASIDAIFSAAVKAAYVRAQELSKVAKNK